MKKAWRFITFILVLSIQTFALASAPLSQVLSTAPKEMVAELTTYIHVDAALILPDAENVTEIGTYVVAIPRDSRDVRDRSLTLSGTNSDKYSQLFGYKSDWFSDMPTDTLSFMSREAAVQIAADFLEEHDIANPSIYQTYAIRVAQIETLTAAMGVSNHGTSIAHFEKPGLQDEAYYVVLAPSFGGISALKVPDSYICINREGMVSAQVNSITGELIDFTPYAEILTPQEAIALFAEHFSEETRNIYVDKITLGYREDFSRLDLAALQTTYVPYWKIDYRIVAVTSPEPAGENAFYIPRALYIDVHDGSVIQ